MDFKKLLKDKYFILFLLILVFSIGLRLYYYNMNTGVWWDEAEYLTRAKELGGVSHVGQDVWSARRPFLLVLIWAGLYRLGASEIYLRIVELLFSIATLFAVYYLTKEMYNEKAALITTLATSVLGLHLFFTARLMTEIPSMCMALFAYYFFFKYYVNEKDKSKLWVSFLFMGLAMFIRASITLAILPMLLIILLKEGKSIFKNKTIIKAILVSVAVVFPYIIYLMFRYKTLNIFLALQKLTGIGEGRFTNPFAAGFTRITDYLTIIPSELKLTYFILMIIGCYIFIDFFIGIDLLYKNKDKKFFREIFTISWVLLFLLFFGFLVANPDPTAYAEPRYLLPILPALLMLSANGLLYLEGLIKKIDKRIAILILLVILAFGTYTQLIYANQMIVSKKDSFSQIKPMGEFLKGKTTHTILVNSNQMELMYYSETYCEGFGKEELFLKKIKDLQTDYVVVSTLFQYNEQWHYEIHQKYQKYLKPAYAVFYDKEQTQLAMLALKVDKEALYKDIT